MRLNWVEAGEGSPVALLHGLFGAAQNFGAVQKALAAAGHRVLALDLRNHGASPHAPGMDYPTMAADVAETLAAARALPAAVLGHSMGGKVAMMLALTRPAAVARLVVADVAPVRYPPRLRGYVEAMRALPLRPGLTRREADAALAAAVPEAAVRGFLLQNLRFETDPPRWRLGLAEIAQAMPEIESFDGVPEGARYEGPVLAIAGERSDYIRPEHHARFRALFPNVRFATVPQAGHWLHAENPQGFLALVAPFLAEG
ncbi:alpha/beta fold hydrolase [Caldovatus aquaticus]|uniref:Alpha/beta fold hydrolase n=1 Tax=Caldovatus aquaticus TaxID=2865671 RepID=A0ABS7EZG0_9PROT|nr:alpha/beta fold hydrolase [Caldovatus aquaticus]MBW8268775.1 alpha/beta fold hydrolase [Caldovatus aquaticus]